MTKVEVLKSFDQNDFESSSSEEEIVLLRSKWDLWKDGSELISHCTDYLWGNIKATEIDVKACNKFCVSKCSLVKGLKLVVPSYATECLKVCDDWNCQAVMWKEKSYYYVFVWSTTA